MSNTIWSPSSELMLTEVARVSKIRELLGFLHAFTWNASPSSKTQPSDSGKQDCRFLHLIRILQLQISMLVAENT